MTEMPDRPNPSATWFARLSPLLLLVVATALYANALFNPFLIDDRDAIQGHPDVVSARGLLTLWGHDYWAGRTDQDRNLYRPITILSYNLNAQATGFNPAAFRVVNVLILVVVAWLIARWLAYHVHAYAAGLAGLLFLVHPKHVTVINNVVGRADLLAVGGIIAFLYLQRRAAHAGQWTWAAGLAAATAVGVAVGAKETGLLVVPAAIAQAWCLRGHEPRRQWLTSAGVVAGPLVLYLIGRLSVIGVTVGYRPSRMDLTVNPLLHVPAGERLPEAFGLAWYYLRQTLVPDWLDTHIPNALAGWSDPGNVAGVIVLVAVTVGLLVACARSHWLSVPLAVALGHYLMIGNLLLPVMLYAANRLMLPFTFAGVCAVAAWLNLPAIRGYLRPAPARVALVVGVLVVSGLTICFRNADWRSHLTLYKANWARQPDNDVAMFLYGAALTELNHHQQARPVLRKLLQRRPDSVQVQHHWAQNCLGFGVIDQAKQAYQRALALSPDDASTHGQLGALALIENDLETAQYHLAAAQRVEPNNPHVMHNLAILALAQGDFDESLRRYHALLEQHPDHQQGRQEYEALEAKLRDRR